MAGTNTVKTRILIISDTHNERLQASTSTHPFRSPLPSADVLLHCGDLTMSGKPEEYNHTLDLLASIDAKTKLVIAGNHDLTLDLKYMETHQYGGKADWEKAREIWFGENGRAKKEGVRMLEEGVHKIEVGNGAVLTLYTSEYQPEFWDWGFPYKHHQDRFNTTEVSLEDAENIAENPVPGFEEREIDVVMTHGPPFKRLDPVPRDNINVGCPHLLKAVARAKPLVHCFGHIHEGWGAEIVDWTDEVVPKMKIEEYKEGGWEKSVQGFETLECEGVKMRGEQCVTLDMSKDGGMELQRGKQTLMVNAAIMDVGYKPVNAPFLVDIDLPKMD